MNNTPLLPGQLLLARGWSEQHQHTAWLQLRRMLQSFNYVGIPKTPTKACLQLQLSFALDPALPIEAALCASSRKESFRPDLVHMVRRLTCAPRADNINWIVRKYESTSESTR